MSFPTGTPMPVHVGSHESRTRHTPRTPRGFGPTSRRTAGALVTLLLILLSAFAWPQAASAATDDSMDSWHATYTVGSDGTTHVTETIVYRFGSSSGRHGMYRTMITRQPDNDKQDQDMLFPVSNVSVSSPDASDEFTLSEAASSDSARVRTLTIQIGDADRRISASTATYVIDYDVEGALRESGGVEQLYWNAVPTDTPVVNDIRISVDVPSGVQELTCFTGTTGSTTPCTSTEKDGETAIFTEASKAAGESVTMGVGITAGVVSNGTPIWEPAAKSPISQAAPWGAGTLVVAGILGALYLVRFKRSRADERFQGIPPGTVPVDPGTAAIGQASKSDVIPVRFDPPQIPVALGGLLVDGVVDSQEMTATLIDLAVRGAIQLRSEDAKHGGAKLFGRVVDPSRASNAYEAELLNNLFGKHPAGAEVELSDPGSMAEASKSLTSDVADVALSQRLMKKVSGTGFKITSTVVIVVVLASFFFFNSLSGGLSNLTSSAGGLTAMLVIGALALVGVVVLVIRASLARRGTRTAVGRAYTDQIEGFEEYLATAEADQLRFEEGRDIFSQYLPWAVAFGVAERWARVCEQLVAMGRLSPAAPYWYYGDPYGFHYAHFSSSIVHAVSTGVTVPTSSGSGGSAFGVGGFSGGGGGGGGAGSW